jgi:hypothetical protein
MGTHRRIDRWLPAAIEEFASAATATVLRDAAGTSDVAAYDETDTGPTNDEIVRFLSEPAPWPLAAILNDLCQRCGVEPPDCVVDAMRECMPVRWDVLS